mmetsp:Transcript_1050/g.2617  ORF Transcript_1050/g.2617 Transcript_1050/m.2617 type:complete len:212 (-) Transcript_1050:890-1525(-)
MSLALPISRNRIHPTGSGAVGRVHPAKMSGTTSGMVRRCRGPASRMIGRSCGPTSRMIGRRCSSAWVVPGLGLRWLWSKARLIHSRDVLRLVSCRGLTILCSGRSGRSSERRTGECMVVPIPSFVLVSTTRQIHFSILRNVQIQINLFILIVFVRNNIQFTSVNRRLRFDPLAVKVVHDLIRNFVKRRLSEADLVVPVFLELHKLDNISSS